MWFKQNEQKSPQQPETPAPRPQQPASAPAAPAQPFAQSQEAPHAAAPVAQPIAAPAANGSRITPGLSLKGEISGREDLWIGGSVDGKLHLENGRVVVGASGRVRGEIEARELVIEGKMDGNLHAAERLEVAATGEVRGDAAAPRIAIQEGAAFNGSMEILRAGESRASAYSGATAGRSSTASRGSRFQSAQAAAAGAVSSPQPPAAAPPETRDSAAAASPTVLLRGIAAESTDSSE